MALLFLDSFDHYQTADFNKKWTGGGGYAIAPGVGRCGTQALQHNGAGNSARALAFSGATVICGFAWKYLEAFSMGGTFVLCGINDAYGVTFIRLNHAADGSLYLSLPDDSPNIAQSPPGLIHFDTWNYIEWKVLIHASAGTTEVRVNNVTQITYSGKTMGTWPSSTGILPPRVFGFQGVTNQNSLFDDLYILDGTGAAPQNDFLGDSRVEYLKPRAAGAAQAWPTVVGSGSHWLAVNDNAAPDGDSSYVEANAAGLTDTNLYDPTGLPSGNPVFGAQLSLYARKTEVGPRVIAPVMNTVVGPSVGPSYESYQYWTTPYGVNPATGLAWTVATINAIDAGVTVIT